jgi:hypothetical protein
MRRFLLSLALVGMLLPLSGCAVGLSLLGAGAGMLADRSMDHILTSTASKTFPVPLEEARTAMLHSITQMELVVDSFDRTESGYAVHGLANNRRVEIELEQLSAQVTRMRVDVKRNFFQRDRATADSIVEQTEWILSQINQADQPASAALKSPPRVSIRASRHQVNAVNIDASVIPADPAYATVDQGPLPSPGFVKFLILPRLSTGSLLCPSDVPCRSLLNGTGFPSNDLMSGGSPEFLEERERDPRPEGQGGEGHGVDTVSDESGSGMVVGQRQKARELGERMPQAERDAR